MIHTQTNCGTIDYHCVQSEWCALIRVCVCVQLFSGASRRSEQDHYLSIADVSQHTHQHTLHILSQGVMLVYDITSKLTFDLVVSLRQKVAIRNSHVSFADSAL